MVNVAADKPGRQSFMKWSAAAAALSGRVPCGMLRRAEVSAPVRANSSGVEDRRRLGAKPLPKDAIPKGAWWEVFHDEELNGYEQQLLAANQSLAAARDRLDEARSLARVASAGLFPSSQRRPQRLA